MPRTVNGTGQREPTMRRATGFLLSALALTLEASAARRSASEIIRSSLGKELERAEAAVVDPTASFKRRVEAWEYLSGQAADKLLKGSPLSGGTASRDPNDSFYISDDVAEASVAAVGDANLPLKTRIEALRVTAVIAQYYSAAGRLHKLSPDGRRPARRSSSRYSRKIRSTILRCRRSSRGI